MPKGDGTHNVTEKMMRWLIHLRDHGPSPREPRSNTGWRCAKAGLTEWDWRNPQTGAPLSRDEAFRLLAAGISLDHHDWKERLTEVGRARIAALETEEKS